MKLYLILTFFLLAATACKNTPSEPAGQPEPEIDQIADMTEKPSKERKTRNKTILFFGDSLTAGYGLEEEEAFPALIQDKIDSLDLDYQVINAGNSGETSAGGKGRIDWVLSRPVDIFVLELGANDMLRGLDINETDKNLREILDKVKELSPKASVIIAGMEAPPNMGPEYTSQFKQMYTSLAADYQAGLIPFLLDGLMGKQDLSIGDGKHPNAIGQKIVRENVWKVLNNYLN